ncbi:hypothetical protein HYX58_03115 [Candidatus Dependentiae bacterium]|nr:hypothetical protein [Candidatus Dependentiae bacterium]
MIIFRVGIFFILQLIASSAYAINIKGIYNRIVNSGYQEQLKQARLLKKKQHAMWFAHFGLTPRESELYALLFKKISNKSANAGPGSEFLVKLIEDIDFSKVDGSQDSIIHAITENIANKKDALFIASDPEIKPIVSELFKSNAMNSVSILATLYVTVLTSWPKVVDQEEFRRAYHSLANSKQVQDAVQDIIQNPKLQTKEKRKSLQILEQEIKQTLFAQISKPLVGKEWNLLAAKIIGDWSDAVANRNSTLNPTHFRFEPYIPFYISSAEETKKIDKNREDYTNSVIQNLMIIREELINEVRKTNHFLSINQPLAADDITLDLKLLGAHGHESEEELKRREPILRKKNALVISPDKGINEADSKRRTELMQRLADAPSRIPAVMEARKKLKKEKELIADMDEAKINLMLCDHWLDQYKMVSRKGLKNKHIGTTHVANSLVPNHTKSIQAKKFVSDIFDPLTIETENYSVEDIANETYKKYETSIAHISNSLLPIGEKLTDREVQAMSNFKRRERLTQMVLLARFVNAKNTEWAKSLD